MVVAALLLLGLTSGSTAGERDRDVFRCKIERPTPHGTATVEGQLEQDGRERYRSLIWRSESQLGDISFFGSLHPAGTVQLPNFADFSYWRAPRGQLVRFQVLSGDGVVQSTSAPLRPGRYLQVHHTVPWAMLRRFAEITGVAVARVIVADGHTLREDRFAAAELDLAERQLVAMNAEYAAMIPNRRSACEWSGDDIVIID